MSKLVVLDIDVMDGKPNIEAAINAGDSARLHKYLREATELFDDPWFERAADHIDAMAEVYAVEHGSSDPETGCVEFSKAGEEYLGYLEDIACSFRSLAKADGMLESRKNEQA